jgi:hypothetical protein
MVNIVRCNICHEWYLNNRGLLIQLGFCHERHASQQEDKNHQHLEHNPLKSCNDQLDHLNPYAVYDNLDDSSGEDSTDKDCPDEGGLDYSTEDKIGINLGEEDDLANYGGDNTDGQFSTAITKIQIRLNNLINRHKAPLQLYNNIIHLFNDYMSSPNFSKYAKLKTRRSFIKKMEVAHPAITALQPANKQLTLHAVIFSKPNSAIIPSNI